MNACKTLALSATKEKTMKKHCDIFLRCMLRGSFTVKPSARDLIIFDASSKVKLGNDQCHYNLKEVADDMWDSARAIGPQSSKPGIDVLGQSSAEPSVNEIGQSSAKPDVVTLGQSSAKPDADILGQSSAKPDVDTLGQTSAKPDVDTLGRKPTQRDVDVSDPITSQPDVDILGQSSAKPDVDTLSQSSDEPGVDEPAESSVQLNEDKDFKFNQDKYSQCESVVRTNALNDSIEEHCNISLIFWTCAVRTALVKKPTAEEVKIFEDSEISKSDGQRFCDFYLQDIVDTLWSRAARSLVEMVVWVGSLLVVVLQ